MLSYTKMNAQQNMAIRQELSAQQQVIVVIAALTATGNIDSLKKQFNAGLTVNQINELLIQQAYRQKLLLSYP
ncbi:hypothetical protein DLD77_02615 [Chitinophaga alhagiae]|uniref:Uncharacterized protein n=3 Tax=Chitinophaga alhagiae TaxID=2203219 RepID=A0ABM6WA05_9BACT|nr:hypothetical protein DLD77_02615 [Chitinophaga alhagiae]